MEPEAPTESQPVAVASVIRGLGAAGAVRITVNGTWRVPVPGAPPVLIVDDGRQRHVIPALPGATGDEDPAALHADFDLPLGLGGGEGLVLSVADKEIGLPVPLPSVPPAQARDVAAEAPPVPAEVIDRAVLAEHRARRAEQSLEGLTERLHALEAHLAEVTDERDRLREELAGVRASEEGRTAGLLDQIARLRESAAAADGLQAALTSAREEADALRAQLGAAGPESSAGLAELGATARELRRHAEEQLAARAPADPPPAQDPFDVALAELRARTAPPQADPDAGVFRLDPLRNTMNLAAMSPGRRARSRLRRVAPSDRHIVDPDAVGPERRPGVPWLSDAIGLFAAEDIPAAGAFLVSLLPDAARTFDDDLVYDIELERVGAYRVTLANSRGTVAARPENGAERPAFTIAGPVGLLAPLGAGGASRRLGGARVTGSRRTLRRLLKGRRTPVDLGDLAGAGVVPDPSLLLRALAASVRPSWIADDFAIAVDVPGDEPITVISEPGRRLQVVGAPPSGGAVRAVLTSSPAALLALLGRVAPPDGEDAMLSGEQDVMTTLLELLDRAQGLPSRS